MVEFVNKNTGGVMWVHETRADEYLAAGHKLASLPPTIPPVKEKPKRKK